MRRSRIAIHKEAQQEWRRLQLAERAARAPMFAVLGTLLCGVATLFRCVGFYQWGDALRQMNFSQVSDAQATKETLIRVTGGLADAGDTFGMSGLALLIGGGFITYALQLGGVRKRWFFWSTLAFGLFFVWQPLVGSLYGIWWLCFLISRRAEFFARQAIRVGV